MEIRATAVLDCSVPNFEPEMPSHFQAFEGGALLGSLTVFAPTSHTAELTAFVLPPHRRRGVFRALLAETEAVLRPLGYTRLLFVCGADSAEGQAVARRWGLELEHAEYLMAWNGEIPAVPEPLDLRPAGGADVPTLTALYTDAFGDSPEEAERKVRRSLPACRIARRAGELVGAATLQEGEVLSVYGVAVRPDLRGRGLGKALMAAVLAEARGPRQGRPVTLEVDSGSPRALALYRSCGFTERRREDYYALPL